VTPWSLRRRLRALNLTEAAHERIDELCGDLGLGVSVVADALIRAVPPHAARQAIEDVLYDDARAHTLYEDPHGCEVP
jgi:hypothetical protein